MSTDRPSIKGAIFQFAIEDLRQLVAEGAISRQELEAKLGPGDADYLDRDILTNSWYDVRAYGRMLEVLQELAGEPRIDYLRKRGAQSAERLLDSGRYPQMEYLGTTLMRAAKSPEGRVEDFGRDLGLLASIARAMINFGTHEVKKDSEHPDRYMIELREMEPYTEALCWAQEGFMNRLAEEHGNPDLWRWERPSQDTVVFHMKQSI